MTWQRYQPGASSEDGSFHFRYIWASTRGRPQDDGTGYLREEPDDFDEFASSIIGLKAIREITGDSVSP